MINFTVGPVKMHKETLEIAGQQPPYFRTKDFSELMLENETGILRAIKAPRGSRCVFLTSSGTGGMEACVADLLSKRDYVAVINGGTFGQRFVDLCNSHSIPYIEVKCEFGQQIMEEQLDRIAREGVTALLVNMDETSSGLLYNMDIIARFCKKNSIFLITDIISAFLADDFNMEKTGTNAVIAASQKALALQPGIAIVALDKTALERLENCESKNYYLNLKDALVNMDRGQTPFTPAVSVLIQMNIRLKQIEMNGGVSQEIKATKNRADYFRQRIRSYPFEMLVKNDIDRSNAVTAMVSKNHKAQVICDLLRERYNIWICPNGGRYKEDVFRVGHIGDISTDEYDCLFNALDDIQVGNLF